MGIVADLPALPDLIVALLVIFFDLLVTFSDLDFPDLDLLLLVVGVVVAPVVVPLDFPALFDNPLASLDIFPWRWRT